jgi:hypothetical protein
LPPGLIRSTTRTLTTMGSQSLHGRPEIWRG